MKHSISIKPGTEYQPILDIIESEDASAEAREFTPSADEDGPYMDLTIITNHEISEETELKVDRLDNVMASVFNIER
jgi:hypothetical protein